MAMGTSTSVQLVVARVLFVLLGLSTFTTVLYTILTDGSPFRLDLLTPWMTATLIDFYANVVPIAIWVFYKEDSLISAAIWIILLICFGSITTNWYIAIDLFKLSPQDPIWFVLLKDQDRRYRGVTQF